MAKVVVGKTSEIPQGKMSHTTAAGKEILVANVDGSYYAINDICNHAGAELHEGEIAGNEITCPWHGAKWDASTWKFDFVPTEIKGSRIIQGYSRE